MTAVAPLEEKKRSLEDYSFNELVARRAELIASVGGSTRDLNDEELKEMIAIVGLLRRRGSGPPKQKAPVTTNQPLTSLI